MHIATANAVVLRAACFVALLSIAMPARCADAAAPPQSITLEAIASGFGAVRPRSDGQMAVLTLRTKGDAMRIDFRGDRGDDGSLLLDRRSGQGWFVAGGDGFAIPMAKTGFEALLVDPAAPCERMQARCERAPGDTVAGIAAEGWRYRHASGRGPDGTSHGTLWIDPVSGLVLSYRGEVTGQSNRREMRGLALSRAPIADDVFALSDRVPVLDEHLRERGAR